jgi:asparagine synthetase B (glutamine-hydrolysing)
MMAMLNSIEYRVPFLDEDLVQYALSIPFAQKSDMRTTKKITRKIHSEIYPKATSYAPKKGFTIPLDKALSENDFLEIQSFLLRKGNIVQEYISKEYVDVLFKALKAPEKYSRMLSREAIYQRILLLYSLELWAASHQ